MVMKKTTVPIISSCSIAGGVFMYHGCQPVITVTSATKKKVA